MVCSSITKLWNIINNNKNNVLKKIKNNVWLVFNLRKLFLIWTKLSCKFLSDVLKENLELQHIDFTAGFLALIALIVFYDDLKISLQRRSMDIRKDFNEWNFIIFVIRYLHEQKTHGFSEQNYLFSQISICQPHQIARHRIMIQKINAFKYLFHLSMASRDKRLKYFFEC